MATIATKTHVCDRCGKQRVGQVGLDFDGGYISMGPINGALTDHVGQRCNGQNLHADMCEDCRVEALTWWRKFSQMKR